MIAFLKKEVLEHVRSGRLLLLGILFTLFGIMNPAVAKLTPWLLEMFAESLEGTGMTVTEVTVTALDSWMQFYKNLPMALIAFVLLESSIFTKEYQTGTLVLSLTKGLARYKVVVAKSAVLTVLWSACYWLHFGITYGYNAYFWDNSVAQNLLFSVVCWWVFGLWVVGLMTLFSTAVRSNTGVLLGTGGVVAVSYLLGLIPKLSKYLPTYPADGTSLIYGVAEADTYFPSLLMVGVMTVACFTASFPLFNKKQL